MDSNAKIFSGRGSKYLAEKIAAKFGQPLGIVNVQEFSDGEIGVEFQESIRGNSFFGSEYICSNSQHYGVAIDD